MVPVHVGASTSTSRRRGPPRRTSASSSSPPASPSWESSTDSGACSGWRAQWRPRALKNERISCEFQSFILSLLIVTKRVSHRSKWPLWSVSSAWISWSIHQSNVTLWRMIESLPVQLNAESLLIIPKLFPRFCPYPSLPPSRSP